jgi:hypothetical protein
MPRVPARRDRRITPGFRVAASGPARVGGLVGGSAGTVPAAPTQHREHSMTGLPCIPNNAGQIVDWFDF